MCKRIINQLQHWYMEGLMGELCYKCSGLDKKLEQSRREMNRVLNDNRYGSPQDYDTAVEFIDQL